jgi:hypothetical protein
VSAIPDGECEPTPSALSRIDELCDRFSGAWKAGGRPRLEDYLAAAPEADRPVLLRGLLKLELYYRRLNHEHPDPVEYRERFPGHAEQVEAAFKAEVRVPVCSNVDVESGEPWWPFQG